MAAQHQPLFSGEADEDFLDAADLTPEPVVPEAPTDRPDAGLAAKLFG